MSRNRCYYTKPLQGGSRQSYDYGRSGPIQSADFGKQAGFRYGYALALLLVFVGFFVGFSS